MTVRAEPSALSPQPSALSSVRPEQRAKRACRHGEQLPKWANGIDPYSSAYYFNGWDDESFKVGLDPPDDDLGPPVAPAETWFLTTGWKRYGLIALDEAPA